MSASLFFQAMQGKDVPRTPVAPKIWLDLAAKLTERTPEALIADPKLAAVTVFDAARLCGADAARLFLFPRRNTRREGDILYAVSPQGKRLGRIDLDGGWATLHEHAQDVCLHDPETLISYHMFKCREPLVSSPEEAQQLPIPTQDDFEHLHGDTLRAAVACAGDDIYPIGDCNSGTLAFCVSLLGMNDTMLALYDDPDLLHILIEKGIDLCIQQARFFLAHGIRVLRYNDSVANMSVISPEMWRTFIKAPLARFCQTIHSEYPDARIYCHICGNVLPILEDLVDAGIDCIAPLDPLGGFSVADVRKRVGPDFVLMGGVNTLSFLGDNPEDLIKEAKTCIREGSNGGRFILGSGCVVPKAASLSMLRALRQAAEA